MKFCRGLIVVFLVAFAPCLPAADVPDSAEQVATDLMKQLDRVAEAVLSVKDQDSADKAVTQLKVICDDMHKIAVRAAAVPVPTKEEQDALMAKLNAKMKDFQTRLAGMGTQLQAAGPGPAATLGQGMMTLGASLKEMGTAFGQLGQGAAAK